MISDEQIRELKQLAFDAQQHTMMELTAVQNRNAVDKFYTAALFQVPQLVGAYFDLVEEMKSLFKNEEILEDEIEHLEKEVKEFKEYIKMLEESGII